MALHKPKQLYVLGKLRFSSIKPMKMIEIWLKITFIFINGHDFQSGIKSIVQPWLALGDVNSLLPNEV
jgi:hypothetical protein